MLHCVPTVVSVYSHLVYFTIVQKLRSDRSLSCQNIYKSLIFFFKIEIGYLMTVKTKFIFY